ncbi:MAG: DUF2357 domain-containing protein [Bacilli bacterium]|nr:DUF2357 domain-containing protein [Bacilli bacterium]
MSVVSKKKKSSGLRLEAAQKAYLGKVDSLVSTSKTYQALLEQLKQTGKNFIRHTQRLENKKFDERFVDELEKGFDCIDRIIAHPRSFIKDEAEVVEAGLAKKINAQSIVHLASHTNFVHSVDKKGNVTPERILTVHAEVDYQIYENRFVMTLIKKCSIFIEKRFQFIKDHGETRDSDVLIMKTSNDIDGALYEVESHIKVSSVSDDEGDKEKNASILERLKSLRDRCGFYIRCKFMEEMKGAKDVSNPIHMTNMLVKNPDYHGAYVLWQFIDSYLDLGVEYGVKETEHEFDDKYFDEIYSLIAAQILTIHTHQIEENELLNLKTKEKIIKPKVLFTLEDEAFYNGKFLYDQFPEARGDEILGVPGVDDKMRDLMEKDLEKKTEDAYRKAMLEEEIEKQKAKDIAEEALERQRKAEEEEERARLEELRRLQQEEARIAKENAERARKDQADRLEEQRKLEELREKIRQEALAKRGEDTGIPQEDVAIDALPSDEEEVYSPFDETQNVKQIVEDDDGNRYVTFYDRKGKFHKFKLSSKDVEMVPDAPLEETPVEEPKQEEAPVVAPAPAPMEKVIVEEEDGRYVTFYDRQGVFHKFKLADKGEKLTPGKKKGKKEKAAPIEKVIIETEEGRFVTFYDRKGIFHKFKLSDKDNAKKGAPKKKQAKTPAPSKKKDDKPKKEPIKKVIVETEEGTFATFYDRKGVFHKFKLSDKKKGSKK